jgi:uncharacterized membrane protein (DUF485 family)
MKNSALRSLTSFRSLSFIGALVACLAVMGFASPAQAAKVVEADVISSALSATGTVSVAFVVSDHGVRFADELQRDAPALGVEHQYVDGRDFGFCRAVATTTTVTISATNAKGTGSAKLVLTVGDADYAA